jgi:methyl-accepting chemotaxis protein
MKLKTKLTAGLTFLFTVILAFGGLGIFYITRLADDARAVLRNNENSLIYCNSMLESLEAVGRPGALDTFAHALSMQEGNITEIGEGPLTAALRQSFDSLRLDPYDTVLYPTIRTDIHLISDLNNQAILRKSAQEERTATGAIEWLSAIVTVLTLVAFSFIINFPGIISRPISALTEGIRAVADRDYAKRIYLRQKDEFGEMADAFNTMAEKLDEYEHSNLSQIMFEKLRIEAVINQMRDAIIGLDDQLRILFLRISRASRPRRSPGPMTSCGASSGKTGERRT